MTIFRAFPFSLSILWRYALVLPFMILVLCIYGLIALMFWFLFGVISPALALLIGFAVGSASSVLPAMIGTRIGLQAKGLLPRNSYASLILPAIGYGLFESFCLLIIMMLTLGVITFATPFNLLELLSLNEAGAEVVFANLLSENAPVTLAITAVSTFWVMAIRSALLVPFAGASIGIDPSGRAHTPFYGFGSGFWSILILVMISYAGFSLIIPLIGLIAELLGLGDAIVQAQVQFESMVEEREIDWMAYEVYTIVGIIILATLWLFSLQCAGAALVFMNHKKRYDIEHEDYTIVPDMADDPPMPKTDLHELMRSRMPQNRR